jgi:hypothetical protein
MKGLVLFEVPGHTAELGSLRAVQLDHGVRVIATTIEHICTGEIVHEKYSITD